MADPLILRSPLLGRAGFVHGFSTREGGQSAPPFDTLNLGIPRQGDDRTRDDASAVSGNLARFLAALSGKTGQVDEVLTVDQVHGRDVAFVGEVRRALPGRVRADAIVAGGGASRTAIGVRVADCVPVLLAEPATGRVAAVHAGWRGVVADVIGHAASAMDTLGAQENAASDGHAGASALRKIAAIGPCIGPCCFEIGEEVATALSARFGEDPQLVRRTGARPHADLRWAVRRQLRTAGLGDDDIDDVPGCTRCDASRFFSFRRDGAASGRHLAAILPASVLPGSRAPQSGSKPTASGPRP